MSASPHARTDWPLEGRRREIVVGVDQTPHALSALRWAAAEARARGTGLRVVHVADDGAPAQAVQRFVSATTAITRRLAGGLPATRTQVCSGSAVDQLVAATTSSALLVLGVDRSTLRARRGELGPLEDAVVARATCPVVVVPLAAARDHLAARVVVGWRDGPGGAAAVLTGLREAALHDARLEVVASGPIDTLADLLSDGLNNSSPVPVRIRQTGLADVEDVKGAAAALLRQARGAQLLVLGSRYGADRPEARQTRVGPVAAAVLAAASCPVMFVSRPEQSAADAPDAAGCTRA